MALQSQLVRRGSRVGRTADHRPRPERPPPRRRSDQAERGTPSSDRRGRPVGAVRRRAGRPVADVQSGVRAAVRVRVDRGRARLESRRALSGRRPRLPSRARRGRRRDPAGGSGTAPQGRPRAARDPEPGRPLRRVGRALGGGRLRDRRHAAQGAAGAGPSRDAHGSRGPARRRHRARLQQPADDHHRLERSADRTGRAEQPDARGAGSNPRSGTARIDARLADPRVQPQAGAGRVTLRRRRNDRRAEAADRAPARQEHHAGGRPLARREVDQRGSRSARTGDAQPGDERARRDAGGRQPDDRNVGHASAVPKWRAARRRRRACSSRSRTPATACPRKRRRASSNRSSRRRRAARAPGSGSRRWSRSSRRTAASSTSAANAARARPSRSACRARAATRRTRATTGSPRTRRRCWWWTTKRRFACWSATSCGGSAIAC